jgi:hypothetical protein
MASGFEIIDNDAIRNVQTVYQQLYKQENLRNIKVLTLQTYVAGLILLERTQKEIITYRKRSSPAQMEKKYKEFPYQVIDKIKFLMKEVHTEGKVKRGWAVGPRLPLAH